MTIKPASFVWHDLTSPDVEAANAFNSQVIGWNMQPLPANDDSSSS